MKHCYMHSGFGTATVLLRIGIAAVADRVYSLVSSSADLASLAFLAINTANEATIYF